MDLSATRRLVRRLLEGAALAVLVAGLPLAAWAEAGISITLEHGSPAEAATKAQLERLLGTYDLASWTFTRVVKVDERAIPHSHPVLTVHTRHGKDDELLLSTFVHEQLHWFLSGKQEETRAAVAALRKLFPKVPAEPAAGGAADEESTYRHLLVCYLERRAGIELLGELRTKAVMDFWANDHYTWVYRTVLERYRDIGQIVFDHNLVPQRRAAEAALAAPAVGTDPPPG